MLTLTDYLRSRKSFKLSKRWKTICKSSEKRCSVYVINRSKDSWIYVATEDHGAMMIGPENTFSLETAHGQPAHKKIMANVVNGAADIEVYTMNREKSDK